MSSEIVKITCNTAGSLTAVSSNTNVATAAINGKTVTVSPSGGGDCNITISVGQDPNYITPTPITLKVTVRKPSNGYEIRQVIQEGRGPQVLSVGDRWPVKMKGRVGILDIDATYYVALIGLDHKKSVETYGRSNAHFKFPYGADGKQLGFVVSKNANYQHAVPCLLLNQ